MYRSTKTMRRVLVTGAICLALMSSSISASQASTGSDKVIQPSRVTCWLC